MNANDGKPLKSGKQQKRWEWMCNNIRNRATYDVLLN